MFQKIKNFINSNEILTGFVITIPAALVFFGLWIVIPSDGGDDIPRALISFAGLVFVLILFLKVLGKKTVKSEPLTLKEEETIKTVLSQKTDTPSK